MGNGQSSPPNRDHGWIEDPGNYDRDRFSYEYVLEPRLFG